MPSGRDGRWPEGALYTYDSEGHTLLVYYPRVQVHERRDFREGDAEFALLYDPPVIFLLFRFGGQFWAEAPFSIHFVAERKRSTTVIEPNGLVRADIEVHLVDSTTRDIVKSCGSASPVTRLPSPQFLLPTLRL